MPQDYSARPNGWSGVLEACAWPWKGPRSTEGDARGRTFGKDRATGKWEREGEQGKRAWWAGAFWHLALCGTCPDVATSSPCHRSGRCEDVSAVHREGAVLGASGRRTTEDERHGARHVRPRLREPPCASGDTGAESCHELSSRNLRTRTLAQSLIKALHSDESNVSAHYP